MDVDPAGLNSLGDGADASGGMVPCKPTDVILVHLLCIAFTNGSFSSCGPYSLTLAVLNNMAYAQVAREYPRVLYRHLQLNNLP